MQSNEKVNFGKSKKAKSERMDKVLDTLKEEYPDAEIALNYNNPWELLVATILSAQCTDKRVNQVTSELFENYNTPEDFVEISQEKLEKEIYSTGFYRNKAKNIKAAAEKIVNEHDGKVPKTMKELTKLDGVGRKTANVVLGHYFDTSGVVVDTHVTRLSNRLGFVDTKNAEKIEYQLMELIPEEEWVMFTHYIIFHGRKICKARKPKCEKCVINEYCPSAFSFNNKNN